MDYQTIRSNRKSFAVQIKDCRLIVRAPLWATDADIDAFVRKNQKWIETHMSRAREEQKAAAAVPPMTDAELHALAQRALEVIPQRVAYYAPRVGVTYRKITIRNQRSRWGSCSSNGNLSFNCLLMLAPPEVLDSVVVHELCHRRYMNHSEKFYAEVLRVFPAYPECRKWLRENGARLLAGNR